MRSASISSLVCTRSSRSAPRSASTLGQQAHPAKESVPRSAVVCPPETLRSPTTEPPPDVTEPPPDVTTLVVVLLVTVTLPLISLEEVPIVVRSKTRITGTFFRFGRSMSFFPVMEPSARRRSPFSISTNPSLTDCVTTHFLLSTLHKTLRNWKSMMVTDLLIKTPRVPASIIFEELEEPDTEMLCPSSPVLIRQAAAPSASLILTCLWLKARVTPAVTD